VRALALAVALLPAAAPAQDAGPAFSPAAVEACLAGAAAEARRGCVGRAAEACMAGPDGSSTVGMTMCLDGEARFWDARLNAVYQALMQAAADADAEAYPGAPATAETLRAAQRAWIRWRDAACADEAAQWGGGSGARPAGVQCFMAMTAERALALEARRAEAAAR
jgi:uncharacterized protein YecT (DUF1311 family)